MICLNFLGVYRFCYALTISPLSPTTKIEAFIFIFDYINCHFLFNLFYICVCVFAGTLISMCVCNLLGLIHYSFNQYVGFLTKMYVCLCMYNSRNDICWFTCFVNVLTDSITNTFNCIAHILSKWIHKLKVCPFFQGKAREGGGMT